MYRFGDTIAAVSSPTSDRRVIIRISGPAAVDMCRRAFSPQVGEDGPRLISGQVEIDSQLSVDAKLYLFVGPHSYTGETVAEIHMHTNRSVTESLLEKLLAAGCRLAEPGEFTARAYLNGKLDLAQAEAVNEVITCSNRFQLAAAEKLLAGQLGEITGRVCSSLMEALSLIEAGLDFSGEEIEFISSQDAVNRLAEIRKKLEELLAGSISYEAMIDLPAAGIAGAANAGKSSLLNRLLGEQRSIVSEKARTTRDVLTGQVTLEHCSCVLFDCAGLVLKPEGILDELAQQAAVESLRHSTVVIFCVDVSKGQWDEGAAIRGLIEPKFLLPVATKSDLVSKEQLEIRLSKLRELFGCDFLVTSAKEGAGIEKLRETIDEKILQAGGRTKLAEGAADAVGLTARHRRVVGDAISNLEGAIRAVKNDEEEVAAAMLRSAYQSLANIGCGDVDERILGEIFERFCIGK